MQENIFKAYDIRGIYPEEINELDVYKIAKAFCSFVKPSEVVVGCDVRISSPSLKKAAMRAITEEGIKVIDVGTISTDMLYFSVANYGYASGFSITASHNPKEYNGMKIVREKSIPISSDSGLFEIRDMAKQISADESVLTRELNEALIEKKDILNDYLQKIRSFADLSKFKKFKIAINANFGLAGNIATDLLGEAGIELIKLNCTPDGTFPKGRPDPLVPENRDELSSLIKDSNADLGIAWDADADRCFFFTEKGEFIEGYFITALLAKILLTRHPEEKIIHDTRLTWAIEDTCKENGGQNIPTKAGHSFIKERMRKENAILGGEVSAHYYFRDYFFCDNGMIPVVMLLEFLSLQEKTLSETMDELFWKKYFVSGEINTKVKDIQKVVENLKSLYIENASKVDDQDGISLDFVDSENWENSWRFNIRPSNTEPLIRLNVEAGSQKLMEQKRDELIKIIEK